MRRAIWRLLLRARFVLWQHRRHDRLVIERGLGLPLVVLPGVLNPALFRSSGVVLEALDGGAVPAGATVLDLGTGSGVLAVAAARSARSVVAVDINPAAVRCARINALLGTRLAVLAPAATLLDWPAHVVLRLVAPATAAEYARRLYALLHRLDEAGAERLLVAAPPRGDDWEAVDDRLHRAAAAADPFEDSP